MTNLFPNNNFKPHTKNEFYVKRIRGGKYFAVIDGYDKSFAAIEMLQFDAQEICDELNAMRNNRLHL